MPIFPLFREVFEKALAKPSPRNPHYVFSDLEAHYRINPDHLTDRVRRVMQAAGLPEVRERLVAMEPRTWRTIRDELIARLPATQETVVESGASRPLSVPAKRRVNAVATRPAIDVSVEQSESPPGAAALPQSG